MNRKPSQSGGRGRRPASGGRTGREGANYRNGFNTNRDAVVEETEQSDNRGGGGWLRNVSNTYRESTVVARKSDNRRGGGSLRHEISQMQSQESHQGILKSESNSLLATSDASANVKSFWKQIEGRVYSSKQFLLREDERKIWLETWMAAADGAILQADILLKALLSLPDSAAITPPVGVIIQVIRKIIARVRSAPQKGSSDVASLEDIDDIVRRIKCNSEPIPEDYNLRISLSELCEGFKSAIGSLMQNGAGLERLATLLLHNQIIAMKDSVLKRMIKPHEATSDNTMTQLQPWNGWRENPSLGWLMNGSWHRDVDLRSSYSSAEEYALSLSKLWTLLTFYWGSGIADELMILMIVTSVIFLVIDFIHFSLYCTL